MPTPQNMGGRYEASQDLLGTLRKQLSDSESERRALEEQLQRLPEKTNCAMQAHEDAQREVQRLRSANELLSREKSNLAHSLQVAQQQAEELRQVWEKLQAAQEELRRQRDRLEEEQEDAVQDGVRAEAGRVELELSMTKLRAEEASLQDSLSKLSALNESLAQDKLDLNRLVAQGLQSSRHTAGGGGTSVQRSTVVFSPEHGHPNQGCRTNSYIFSRADASREDTELVAFNTDSQPQAAQKRPLGKERRGPGPLGPIGLSVRGFAPGPGFREAVFLEKATAVLLRNVLPLMIQHAC
ncbi:PREDICTED: putative ciliary rootlet coiled-coil protein-like 2 protein [Mandrillus leucophaeus]|uniref:putative ciliary rootlet coiled-coil protein-like 2 protein n=1 Tax=Mandrillus leucophaeus TaxID=9568 RepID=UPI0005F54FD4|nr:PREDICTED: putative ciliary rootlet coiled-coil protein-like 2 protein [Mandrillus leucophaeus]